MQIKSFRGLNTVSDPLRSGLGWLAQADNVDITDSGALVKRGGYSLALAGSMTGAFSTLDHRMFFVDGGALKAKTRAGAVTLKTGLSAWPMAWAEINDDTFFCNGVNSGIIRRDHTVLDWAWPAPTAPVLEALTGTLPAGQYQVRCAFVLPDGRLTGSSPAAQILLAAGGAVGISAIPQAAGCRTEVYIAPANSTVFSLAGAPSGTATTWNGGTLGQALSTADLSPLPTGCDVIAFWRGRAYAAQYFPEAGQTAIWRSQALRFHLFDLAEVPVIVPGRITMLAPTAEAIVIGTDDRIHAFDGSLVQLAPYGVPPGQHHASVDGRTTVFWSARGACQAMPFANLTERQISVAPGVRAGGAVIHSGGQVRYVVCLQQGGTAFNPFN